MLEESTFSFTALDKSGARIQGQIDARDTEQAREILKVKELNPLVIEPFTQQAAEPSIA
jgi:type II secretory pathway component PulF